MYNSHLMDTNIVSKTWKVLSVILFMVFIWDVVTTGTHANVSPKANPEIRIVKKPITSTPVLTREQQLKIAYDKAKFLEVVDTGEKINYKKTDLFCLAKNIYHEAGSEPIKGRYAVAQVTLNRTKDPKFEGSICDVVLAENQFSWANDQDIRWSIPSGPEWRKAKQIALDMLNGKRVKGMEDALYYHADYVNPHWRHVERLARIGAHIFYVSI
jgi:spore germination cell wall hydrolase CwlJ-like protein